MTLFWLIRLMWASTVKLVEAECVLAAGELVNGGRRRNVVKNQYFHSGTRLIIKSKKRRLSSVKLIWSFELNSSTLKFFVKSLRAMSIITEIRRSTIFFDG